jgi:hypothetical protein
MPEQKPRPVGEPSTPATRNSPRFRVGEVDVKDLETEEDDGRKVKVSLAGYMRSNNGSFRRARPEDLTKGRVVDMAGLDRMRTVMVVSLADDGKKAEVATRTKYVNGLLEPDTKKWVSIDQLYVPDESKDPGGY